METKNIRAGDKLVFSVHLTLKPGMDDDFIFLVRNTPSRFLAGRVCEAVRNGLTTQPKYEQNIESAEVNHD
jgi:hypothetical protein